MPLRLSGTISSDRHNNTRNKLPAKSDFSTASPGACPLDADAVSHCRSLMAAKRQSNPRDVEFFLQQPLTFKKQCPQKVPFRRPSGLFNLEAEDVAPGSFPPGDGKFSACREQHTSIGIDCQRVPCRVVRCVVRRFVASLLGLIRNRSRSRRTLFADLRDRLRTVRGRRRSRHSCAEAAAHTTLTVAIQTTDRATRQRQKRER